MPHQDLSPSPYRDLVGLTPVQAMTQCDGTFDCVFVVRSDGQWIFRTRDFDPRRLCVETDAAGLIARVFGRS